MIGKIIKGIAALFLLAIVFNIFFERASSTLKKGKDKNKAIVVSEKEPIQNAFDNSDKRSYLPPIVLLANMYDSLGKVKTEYITLKIDRFQVRTAINDNAIGWNYISFRQYRFSGSAPGIIQSDQLKKFGVTEYDDLYNVIIKIKKADKSKKISSPDEIMNEFGSEKYKHIYEVLNVYATDDPNAKNVELTTLDNTTGIAYIDICESTRDNYRNADKTSVFYYCADLVGTPEQWGCVKNGISSYSDFNLAVEGCGVINNLNSKVSICENIEKRFLSKHGEDENPLSCSEMTAYMENWECLQSHYVGNADFYKTARQCGFTELEY